LQIKHHYASIATKERHEVFQKEMTQGEGGERKKIDERGGKKQKETTELQRIKMKKMKEYRSSSLVTS
jgi:hypothetical protein